MTPYIRVPHMLRQRGLSDARTPRPERVLLLCYYDPTGISTVKETVAYLQSLSKFSVTILNMFEHRANTYLFPLQEDVDLDAFSAIIIHNTIAYNVDNARSLDRLTKRKLKDFKGVKILMKQDENFRFMETAAYIGQANFDLILTCLPEQAIPLVYPPSVAGTPRFERMLTGYVTPALRQIDPNHEPRPIDIGYRGSIQPLSFGRLAFEKRKIGDDIVRLTAGRGLSLNISSRWEDRIGGTQWFEFLRNCKATLGAESGASIFDLDGDLEARCSQAEQELGPFRDDHEYAESFLAKLSDLEDNVHYHQISPRHFEAAATGTLQLLYPGDYSGIFTAGRHFFALERDYSNLEDAIRVIDDPAERLKITRAAHEEIILNEKYWIETFVKRVDELLVEMLDEGNFLQKPVAQSPPAINVLMIASHEPRIDPRLKWVEECAPDTLRIHQVGIIGKDDPEQEIQKTARGNLEWSTPRRYWHASLSDYLHAVLAESLAGMAAIHELQFLERALELSDDRFCELFGAPLGQRRVQEFRWYLQHVLSNSITLIEESLRSRGVHAIIACDLVTVPAALALKGLWGVPVVYDAHEYWPESDMAMLEFEQRFWIELERRLLPHTDYRQTVSPGLAALMQEQYDLPFSFVPNCEPLCRVQEHTERLTAAGDSQCSFLYQGGFAPYRGIDLLISAWPNTMPGATLLLRGIDNAYKQQMRQLADATGLLGTRIQFPEPVDETNLIAAASAADVGLIPYTATGNNYKNCCPNKTSQYMAAGLPILANETDFVADTIARAGAGRVVNFTNTAALVDAVNVLSADATAREKLGSAGNVYFRETFHWENVSGPFYAALGALTKDRKPEAFCVFAPIHLPRAVEEKDTFEMRLAEFLARIISFPQRLYSLILKSAQQRDLEPLRYAIVYRLDRLRRR